MAEVRLVVDAWTRFDLALRTGDGVDDESYAALRSALSACAKVWAHQDAVPRILANVLVEIVPATEANADLYHGAARAQVLTASVELQELAWACVPVTESEMESLLEGP
jgi:hypothetical protein